MPAEQEKKNLIEVQRIEIYGAGDLHRIAPFIYEGHVGSEITGFGKQFKDIHADSITLGDQAALFQAYLARELGEYQPPKELGKVLDYLFNEIGRSNFTNDACDYDNGKNLRKAKPSDRSVRWIVRPDKFEFVDDKWQAVLGEDSNVYRILVPEGGYMELTNDGFVRPDTGTPFSTVPSREEAEKSWTSRGYDRKFAQKVVSRFWSKSEGQGTTSVIRWYDTADGGRFDVYAYYDPDDMYFDVGSFVSKPERARPRHGTVAVELMRDYMRRLSGIQIS